MANPLFPDVPIALGVPVVLRQQFAQAGSIVNSLSNISIGSAQQAISGAISNVQQGPNGNLINGEFGESPTPLTGDSSDIQNASSQTGQWGVYNQSGNLIIDADQFKSLDYQQTWRLPNYPMEQGAFQSYNKVQTPFEARIILVKSGSPTILESFFSAINTAANSIDLYNINTPGQVYKNVSIEHVNYKRSSSNGVSMISAELSLLEIRIAAASTLSNTTAPNGADTVSGGTTQSAPVTTGANTQANGSLTSEASSTTGVAGKNINEVTPLPTAISQSIATAITATQTPAVIATLPNLPVGISNGFGGIIQGSAEPVDASGNPLTSNQVNAGIPIYAFNPITGNVIKSVANSITGAITQTIVTSPPKIQ